MIKHEIKIDINKLNSDELKFLSQILYKYGHMEECREVNHRKYFIEH
jgi:hypothetical protein